MASTYNLTISFVLVMNLRVAKLARCGRRSIRAAFGQACIQNVFTDLWAASQPDVGDLPDWLEKAMQDESRLRRAFVHGLDGEAI
jgi:hypothetical protein